MKKSQYFLMGMLLLGPVNVFSMDQYKNLLHYFMGTTILMQYAQNGTIEDLKKIIKQHPNETLNYQELLSHRTALHYALINGNDNEKSTPHNECVYALLDQGARADLPDSRGLTALHWAIIKNGSCKMVNDILTHFPNSLNLQDNDGYTPLIYSLKTKNESLFHCLLQHKPDLKKKTKNGHTITMAAVIFGTPKQLEILLLYGSPLNNQSPKGETALMRAARIGKFEHVKVLVENGALLSLTDCYKQTVFGHCKAGDKKGLVIKKYLELVKNLTESDDKTSYIKSNSQNIAFLQYFFDYALHRGERNILLSMLPYCKSNKELGEYIQTNYGLPIPCKNTTKLSFMNDLKTYLQNNNRFIALKNLLSQELTPENNLPRAIKNNNSQLVKLILPLLKLKKEDIVCFLKRLENPQVLLEKHISVKNTTNYKISLGENEDHKNPLLSSKLNTNKDTDFICIKVIQDQKEDIFTENCLNLWSLYKMAQKNKARDVENKIITFAQTYNKH